MSPLLGLFFCFNIDTLYHPHFIGEKTLAESWVFSENQILMKNAPRKQHLFISTLVSKSQGEWLFLTQRNVYCLGKNVNYVNLQNFS